MGRKMLKDAVDRLRNQLNRPAEAEMLGNANVLFDDLVKLAAFQTGDKTLRFNIGKSLGTALHRFLVPTQNVLMHAPKTPGNPKARAGDVGYFPSDMMFISAFHPTVEVASSKAKPKTITLTTTCGKEVKFLCKQETNGDLRKDARLMEFNTIVNRLLREDPEGRRRSLSVRTYAVVCLTEECGILEWVNNTQCIRHIIKQAHTYSPVGVHRHRRHAC